MNNLEKQADKKILEIALEKNSLYNTLKAQVGKPVEVPRQTTDYISYHMIHNAFYKDINALDKEIDTYINDMIDSEYEYVEYEIRDYILEELEDVIESNNDSDLISTMIKNVYPIVVEHKFTDLDEKEEYILSKLSVLINSIVVSREENIQIDLDPEEIRDYILNTPVNLVLIPDQDLDDEGKALYNAIVNKTSHPILDKLFASQDYDRNIAKEELNASLRFANSFEEEVENMDEAGCCQYVILASLTLNQILDIRNNQIAIDVSDCVQGIANLTHGGGSMLEVTLDKPFVLGTEELGTHFQADNFGWGYSLNDIYDFIDYGEDSHYVKPKIVKL